jgi:hypothetical protein
MQPDTNPVMAISYKASFFIFPPEVHEWLDT